MHIWGPACSVTMLPAEPISKFPDCTLLPLASSAMCRCALSQPGQQDLAPHSSLLLLHTTLNQSPCFLSITVPPATWGNDSITYDPIHLLMMFGHSKAHLCPIKGSSHSLYSFLGVSIPKIWSCRVCACGAQDAWVCEHPLQLFPIFLLFWDLDQFLVCLRLHVGRVRRRRAMCQEKHMALLGYRHLPLDQWERFSKH